MQHAWRQLYHRRRDQVQVYCCRTRRQLHLLGHLRFRHAHPLHAAGWIRTPAGCHCRAGTAIFAACLLLSYAKATISSISGCSDVGASTANCSRNGDIQITITGANLDPSAATVLIGRSQCNNVHHDPFTSNSKLTCSLSAGSRTLLSVMIVQSGGPQSIDTVTLSYATCGASSFSVGSSITCTLCSPGSIRISSAKPRLRAVLSIPVQRWKARPSAHRAQLTHLVRTSAIKHSLACSRLCVLAWC